MDKFDTCRGNRCPRGRPPRGLWKAASVLGVTGFLVAIDALSLSGAGFAKVVSESSTSARRTDPPLETGGNPIISSGPFRLSCSQFGTKIIEGWQVERLSLSPFNVIGSLSFRRPGDHGQTMVVPLGDGSTTCVLAQEPEFLKRATAAMRRAVTSNQPMTWSLARAQANGSVVPLRTFTDGAGRTCRDVKQSMMIDGHLETGTGTACRERDGAWRLAP